MYLLYPQSETIQDTDKCLEILYNQTTANKKIILQ